MKIIDFFLIVGKLKKTKRTGWARYEIANVESVAEHSFRMAIMAMILASKLNLDGLKTLKMVLIHDLAEAETGDIVSKRGAEFLANKEEKVIVERKAMVQISEPPAVKVIMMSKRGI